MSQKRVLIVEDEATLRRIIADALTLAGYSVVVAEDGEVGLQRYRDFNPHLPMLNANWGCPKQERQPKEVKIRLWL